MPISLTYTGIIVSVLLAVFEPMGIILPEGDLTSTINTIGVIVAGVVALYGRHRAGGIHWHGKKK